MTFPDHLLFVYGSLKRGYELHHELSQQQFLDNAATEPMFRLFNCGTYPGMVKVVSAGRSVKGELYKVTRECLARLDDVEGVDEGCYVRCRIPLLAPWNNHSVWGYIYLKGTSTLADCGNEWPN
ncbi:MAG: gamma-glutamylcyclotransferase family protein [Planctomycetaceae bacterium]